jgi:hypothetical protein
VTTKIEEMFCYLDENPNATSKELADAFDVSEGHARRTKLRWKRHREAEKRAREASAQNGTR